MRRNTFLTLAGLALLTLPGCRAIYGDRDTSLLVVNNSREPVTVTYNQSPDNSESSAVSHTQRVLPGYSTRFRGIEGDRLTVLAEGRPPISLDYSDRSQVIEATDDGFSLTKGFNAPTRD